MSQSIRIATFNVENLFARYKFREDFSPLGEDGFSINNLAFSIYNDDEKKITAKAIKEVNADVLCLQEVESLPLLDRFNSTYLASKKYKHRIVVDGNDPRSIDVAVLSRYPIESVKSNRHLRNAKNSASLFSRDCLEVTVSVDVEDGKTAPLKLYVNHFKSMMGGREGTHERRVEQVDGAVEIMDEQQSATGYDGNFAILGDFNDYVDDNTSLKALLDHDELRDVLMNSSLPDDEKWTHFWGSGGDYRQLDYIFLSRQLYERAGSPDPTVFRKGLPWRAERYSGDRLDDVGENSPKASDHCPLYVDVPKAALKTD